MDKEKGKREILVADETSEATVNLWDKYSDMQIFEGDILLVKGLYKSGKDQTLNVNQNAIVDKCLNDDRGFHQLYQ